MTGFVVLLIHLIRADAVDAGSVPVARSTSSQQRRRPAPIMGRAAVAAQADQDSEPIKHPLGEHVDSRTLAVGCSSAPYSPTPLIRCGLR